MTPAGVVEGGIVDSNTGFVESRTLSERKDRKLQEDKRKKRAGEGK